MKFTQIPTDSFKNIQLNAGIVVDSFTPGTGVIGNLFGATSGGISFTATPTYTDFGEDIDNCPTNTMELKRLDYWEAKMSGTLLTVTAATAAKLVGPADVSGDKVAPRGTIDVENDFNDVWWVGDYSDLNGEQNGGFVAIHLMNAMSNAGFSIQSTNKGKGQFSFEFLAHYSIDDIDAIPFEIYVKQGTAEAGA